MVAAYGPADVDRLLDDAGIIRNRSKIDAAIHNAGVVAELGRDFVAIFTRYEQPDRPRPATLAEVPASTPQSIALARELKERRYPLRRRHDRVRAHAGRRTGR